MEKVMRAEYYEMRGRGAIMGGTVRWIVGEARGDLQVDVHRGGWNGGEEAVDGRGEAGLAGGESVY